MLVGDHADRGVHEVVVPVVPDDAARFGIGRYPAGTVEILGEPERRAGQGSGLGKADDGMWRHHHGQVFRADDLLAVKGSVAEQHAQPLRHVLDRGVDAAGRSVGVCPRQLRSVAGEGGDRAAHDLVRSSDISRRFEGLLTGRARPHAEGIEYALLDVLRPRLPAGRAREIAGHEKEVVHVCELAAEARHRVEVLHVRDDVVGRKAEERHAVARVRRHAAVLRHQIGDLELARHPGVAHLERRKVVDHAIAPPDLAIVDLHRHHRRGEGLRRRADLEDGVGIDRLGPAHALHAEALRVDHLVVLHDRDRHARHSPTAAARSARRSRAGRGGRPAAPSVRRRCHRAFPGQSRGRDHHRDRQRTSTPERASMHHSSSGWSGS